MKHRICSIFYLNNFEFFLLQLNLKIFNKFFQVNYLLQIILITYNINIIYLLKKI